MRPAVAVEVRRFGVFAFSVFRVFGVSLFRIRFAVSSSFRAAVSAVLDLPLANTVVLFGQAKTAVLKTLY